MENLTTEYKTLGQALKTKSYGVFKNDKDEYCNVRYYYVGDKKKFQIIFSKGLGLNDIATRYAINTTSEKKVLKVLNSENFILVD